MVARADLVAAVGRDEQDPVLLDRVAEEGDEVERGVVGPLEVLEHDQHRLGGAEHREHLLEQREPRSARDGDGRAVGKSGMSRGSSRTSPASASDPQRPQRVDERQVRKPGADELDAASGQHGRPATARARGELAVMRVLPIRRGR